MDEAEQRDLIARYVAAYNRFDVDGMLALLTDDVRFENVSGGPPHRRPGRPSSGRWPSGRRPCSRSGSSGSTVWSSAAA
jgi:ketosteroid isomerase-like protein